MRIVFWQNCLSPHQLPYIEHLIDDDRVDEVVVVAGGDVSEERKRMGWHTTLSGGTGLTKKIIAPSDFEIREIMGSEPGQSWHMFSGIRADSFVFHCLQISLSYNLKRGIITERPNTYDFKHNLKNAKPYWMHRLRFLLQDWKYARQIQTVFAMGQDAVNYYKSLPVQWSVFPFCYCTEPAKHTNQESETTISPVKSDSELRYLFCGSLSSRKNPLSIVRVLSNLRRPIRGQVKVIGDGALRSRIEKYIGNNHLTETVSLLGIRPQSEISQHMAEADILILPSLYDGWGAVVNEALQAGCFIICSDACGASDLIKADARLGIVFHCDDEEQLRSSILWCEANIDYVLRNRIYRAKWAEMHISGKVVSGYFVDCLCGKNVSPIWLKDKSLTKF